MTPVPPSPAAASSTSAAVKLIRRLSVSGGQAAAALSAAAATTKKYGGATIGADKTAKTPAEHNFSLRQLGTALPASARVRFRLRGQLPAAVESIDNQQKRALARLRSQQSDFDKYMFLATLRNTNLNLFYCLLLSNLQEITPLIYTPTVGAACQQYSHIYPFLAPVGQPDGLYINTADLASLPEALADYRAAMPDFELDPQIAVITDGSRILGLGDLGMNGMGIPVGKLQLYVAAAGLDPMRTLPVCVDMGTDNEELLADPLYLGLRQHRPSEEEFMKIMDAVLSALHTAFPKMLIQFEDFSSEHAFDLLDANRRRYLCFNDDIQGTGAVILAGFMNAIRVAQADGGVDPKDHRILFFGAGSAGVGVARQLAEHFRVEYGMTEEQAKQMFWLVDSKGLITADRGDKLARHKVYFARTDNNGRQSRTLLDVVRHVRPTALIGLSSQPGVFDEQVLREMAAINKRPIVFPLSNPATQAECTFADSLQYTEGRVIFASGTAFPSEANPRTGREEVPGQGNNMYIFPGLGLGAVLARPPHITDSLIYVTASALASSLTEAERSRQQLYPDISRIREVSAEVAAAVCEQAVREGLATDPTLLQVARLSGVVATAGYMAPGDVPKGKGHEAIVEFVRSNMWTPIKRGDDIEEFMHD